MIASSVHSGHDPAGNVPDAIKAWYKPEMAKLKKRDLGRLHKNKPKNWLGQKITLYFVVLSVL